MKEIKEHKAYELLKSKYEEIAIDYVILSTDGDYEGIETHKKAVIEAFGILNARNDAAGIDYKYELEPERMNAVSSSMEDLLQLPADGFYDSRTKENRAFSIPSPTPYWFAFLESPCGVPYLKSDFIAFNDVLFPNKNCCEVYRWNDDFSDYFDEGKEWWGTGLWTVFDRTAKTVIVIGASLTD